MSPTHLDALLDHAAAVHRRGTGADAASAWAEARNAAGADPRRLQFVADRAFELGALDASIAALEAAREAAPVRSPAADALSLTRIGALQVRLGELDAAVANFERALERSADGYTALQLGNAQRYRGRREAARALLERAWTVASRDRDGGLALATQTALGELELDAGGGQAAIERFGEALGLSEMSGKPALSVAPLAGLAHAHASWRAPAKAAPLAERAVRRAREADDAPGLARALWALGVAERSRNAPEGEVLGRFAEGVRVADAAPHRPLWLRIAAEAHRSVRAAEVEAEGETDDLPAAPALLEAAVRMGMSSLVPWLEAS